jgi:hypothetical protein
MPNSRKVTAGDIISEVPRWAFGGAVQGIIGRWTLSFFNPVLARAAPGFLMSAALGAIATPLAILPALLLDKALANSSYLNTHPNLKDCLTDTASILLNAGVVTVAALLLNAPLTATLASYMILPSIIYAYSMLSNGINAVLQAGVEPEAPPVYGA